MFGLKRGLQFLGKGSPGPLRGDYSGALVTTDGHARFQEAVLNGNVWYGANLGGTGVTFQAGLSATSPVLSLFNPVNSPVYLSIWHADFAFTASAFLLVRALPPLRPPRRPSATACGFFFMPSPESSPRQTRSHRAVARVQSEHMPLHQASTARRHSLTL